MAAEALERRPARGVSKGGGSFAARRPRARGVRGVERPLVENAYVAGVATIAGRPVTCDHGWFHGCRSQLTALCMDGLSLYIFHIYIFREMSD